MFTDEGRYSRLFRRAAHQFFSSFLMFRGLTARALGQRWANPVAVPAGERGSGRMTYQAGDHVCTELPRRVLCRVLGAESLNFRNGPVQLLKLQPLEGSQGKGTPVIRRAEAVVSARIRDLWRADAPIRPLTRRRA